MQAQKSTLTERLGQIEPVEVDGEVLWEAEKVYRAFHLDPRAASKCIRREHKRRVFVFGEATDPATSTTSTATAWRRWPSSTASSRARRSWPPCAGPDRAMAR